MFLLEPLGFEQAKKVCRTFAFARNDTKLVLGHIEAFPAAVAAFGGKSPARPSRISRILSPLGSEGLVLLKARLPAAGRRIADFLGKYHAVRPSLSGHDLKALGITPGPLYQKILRGLLEAKLDGKVRTREDEMEFVLRMSKSQ